MVFCDDFDNEDYMEEDSFEDEYDANMEMDDPLDGDSNLDGEPDEWQTMAFTCGYNDRDSDTPNVVKALRWKNNADPHLQPQDSVFTYTWGDLEFGIGFNIQ